MSALFNNHSFGLCLKKTYDVSLLCNETKLGNLLISQDWNCPFDTLMRFVIVIIINELI